MTLSVARVTTYAWPTGRQPWETTVPDTDARVQEHADGAVVEHGVVEHQTVAARGPGRPRPCPRRPARLGAFARSRSSTPSAGIVKGSASSRSTRAVASSVSAGRPVSAQPAVEALGLQADRLDGPDVAGPEADGRPLLDLPGAADDR